MKNKSYLSENKPPVCLHALGQGLVDALFNEGKELQQEHARLVQQYNEMRDFCNKIGEMASRHLK